MSVTSFKFRPVYCRKQSPAGAYLLCPTVGLDVAMRKTTAPAWDRTAVVHSTAYWLSYPGPYKIGVIGYVWTYLCFIWLGNGSDFIAAKRAVNPLALSRRLIAVLLVSSARNGPVYTGIPYRHFSCSWISYRRFLSLKVHTGMVWFSIML
jgi:hypothetical protein